MTEALAVQDQGTLAKLHSREYVDMIKDRYAKGVSDLEFQVAIEEARRLQLDPVAKQIYFIKRGNQFSTQVSIDGMRLIAERSGSYEGQTPAQWCGSDGKWVDVWLEDRPPAAARVGVYRRGFREPMVAVARYNSYAQQSPTWKGMPDVMLAKCAESLALRKAFPNDLSGAYTVDEMEQAGGRVVVAQPAQAALPERDEDAAAEIRQWQQFKADLAAAKTPEALEGMAAAGANLPDRWKDVGREMWKQAKQIMDQSDWVPDHDPQTGEVLDAAQ